jgi:CRP-like cAMP-binding protein
MNPCAKLPLAGGNQAEAIIWASQASERLRDPNPVMVRMRSLAHLSAAEIDVLHGLPLIARQHPAQTELCTERRVQIPKVLLSGWCCQQRLLGDGRRQIIRFLTPGDIIGSIIHPSVPANCAVIALTPIVVADARSLLRALEGSPSPLPGLAKAIWQMYHAEELTLHDQVVRLGRQTAYERVLHLILELHSRLDAIGLVHGDSFDFPLTQEVLADALGLSLVHVNRTLQQIRRDRVVELRGGRVTLLQPDSIKATADWDETRPQARPLASSPNVRLLG